MHSPEILVRVLGLGLSWSFRPGRDLADPFRFTKHAVYFNTTGVEVTSSVGRFWTVPGFVRFNGNSGLVAHEPTHVLGSVFACIGVTQYSGQNRLLALGRRHSSLEASHYLVAVESQFFGPVEFLRPWRNNGVTVIAASEHKGRQQVLLLLTQTGQFATAAGTWSVTRRKGLDQITVTGDQLKEAAP